MKNNRKIFFVAIGTIAEFIKLAPVIIELKNAGAIVIPIATGQNDLKRSDLYSVVFPEGIEYLVTDRIIKQTPFHFLLWTVECFIKSFFTFRCAFNDSFPARKDSSRLENVMGNNKVHLLVHGDTVSTFMASLVGWLVGAEIIHVEAGLRSFNIFRPFPEELCRIFVSRIAKIAFCPGEWACNNIKNDSRLNDITVVNTFENTLIDSMRIALKHQSALDKPLSLPGRYFLFVCHRQENLYDKEFLSQMISRIGKISATIQCVVILHEPAEAAMIAMGLYESLRIIPNIKIYPRQSYFAFTSILKDARFVITDGGSNQEECYFLGKACLILRKESERLEGLGYNAILSMKNFALIDDFLSAPERWTRRPVDTSIKPSLIISKYLMAY